MIFKYITIIIYTKMSYPICPTCGGLLSNIWLNYLEDIRKLCIEFNNKTDDPKFNTRKEEIVASYIVNPDRYCCKMRLINSVELVRIIN